MQLLMAEQHKCQEEETRENVLHEYKSRSRCLINRILLRRNKNNVIPTPINCHSSITCMTPTRFAVAVDVETQIQIDRHSASPTTVVGLLTALQPRTLGVMKPVHSCRKGCGCRPPSVHSTSETER
jgi:hypothetical protein